LSFIIEVAISVPLYQTFDYLCSQSPPVGGRVKVPFRRKKVLGIVLSIKKESAFDTLKTVETVLDDTAILDSATLNFLFWAAKYYHHPIGEVLINALPKNLRLGKPPVIKKELNPIKQTVPAKFKPNPEQIEVINKILSKQQHYQSFLLHGVTGSGKTEVYLNLAQTLLAQNKQILVLVPEIGLTPQMITRFSARLNTSVVAIHSQLNESQKLDAYLLAKQNKAGVVLGTRSAIFTPMPRLGLIIIDEEHDNSFKQQSGFRYCAKNLSFIRAKQADIPLVLGTATPSLSLLKNIIDNKTIHLSLPKRAGGSVLPRVSLIDMRNHFEGAFSPLLIEKINTHLKQNNQVMLFINRRGYAPVYYCTECDWKAHCQHCDAKMTYHRTINRLKCHHCGFESLPKHQCPHCQSPNLQVLGFGTQRLEETLQSHFANASIIRIDRDSTRRKKAFDQHLKKINTGEPCLIIGTQMLAKGHDFSKLTMVGILDVDAGFLSTNFRATEYLSQLLIQVAGRAGRHLQQGEVVIQTRYPEHPMFNYVLNNRYTQFASTLLKQRMQALLPPFSHQALLCANAKQQQLAHDFLQEAANLLKSIKIDKVEIWGPVAQVIEKKSDYYYMNLYIQSENRKALHQMLSTFQANLSTLKLKNKIRWYLDIDPTE
jgi:primosomal protein N' (replication factor Y)